MGEKLLFLEYKDSLFDKSVTFVLKPGRIYSATGLTD